MSDRTPCCSNPPPTPQKKGKESLKDQDIGVTLKSTSFDGADWIMIQLTYYIYNGQQCFELLCIKVGVNALTVFEHNLTCLLRGEV